MENGSSVAVVIPVFNTEKYLRECIDSALHQTYENLQIVLIDDGSTDRSVEICDEYVNLNDRIYAIHQENKGLSAARNLGVNIAKKLKSDYVMFFDSDDIICSEMIEKMVVAAEKYKAPLVACSLMYMNVGNDNKRVLTPIDGKRTDNSIEVIDSYTIINRLWNSEYDTSFFAASTCKLFNLSFFEETLHFKEGIIYEDDDLANRLFIKKYPVVLINSAMYYWRMNETSISHSKFSEKKCYILTILKERILTFTKDGFLKQANRTAKIFCEIYIEKFYLADHANHVEWIEEYKNDYKIMKKMCKPEITNKDKLRYKIFEIAPQFYKKYIIKR